MTPLVLALSIGLAIGQQGYQSNLDDKKIVTELDVAAEHKHLVLEVAGQYADLSAVDGPLIAVHPDITYRFDLSDRISLVAGAGPSFIRVGGTASETTWNAMGEIGYTWRSAVFFARVRQYDFSISDTRTGEAGPSGPVISLGARFRFSGGSF
jgi:hypothetical protein